MSRQQQAVSSLYGALTRPSPHVVIPSALSASSSHGHPIKAGKLDQGIQPPLVIPAKWSEAEREPGSSDPAVVPPV
ncbi:MAG: hypothetical protein AB1724_05815 [Thermodesulfobacteriota bacterium]